MIKDIKRAMRRNQRSSEQRVRPSMAKEGTFAEPRKSRRQSTLQPVIKSRFIPINEEADSSSKDSLTEDSEIEESKESTKKEKPEKSAI